MVVGLGVCSLPHVPSMMSPLYFLVSFRASRSLLINSCGTSLSGVASSSMPSKSPSTPLL